MCVRQEKFSFLFWSFVADRWRRKFRRCFDRQCRPEQKHSFVVYRNYVFEKLSWFCCIQTMSFAKWKPLRFRPKWPAASQNTSPHTKTHTKQRKHCSKYSKDSSYECLGPVKFDPTKRSSQTVQNSHRKTALCRMQTVAKWSECDYRQWKAASIGVKNYWLN